VSPLQAGSVGVSLARAFAAEGHRALLTGRASLLAGNRVLIAARRYHLDAAAGSVLVRDTLARIARFKPDAVLVIKGRFVSATAVARMRDVLGVPIINYYPDDPFWPAFHEQALMNALREYDLVCIWSRILEDRLKKAGIRRTMYLPFAHDPADYPMRPEGYPYRFDAVFVGQWQPVRQRFLEAIAHLNLGIAGSGWERATAGSPLSRSVLAGDRFARDAAGLYWSSKVGINILHDQNAAVSGHNMRSWELPATGTATVATMTACHKRLYGDGAALVSSPAELRSEVEDLLRDDARRERLAASGAEAVKRGTYRARVRALVDEIDANPVAQR